MNMTQIKYFLTVAKYLNFTNAANALYISQPALSRQIQIIEEEIGCILFTRNSRNVQMTPSAKLLVKELGDIYNEYNIAIAKAQSAYQGLTGEINIGILDGTRISDLFPGVLSYFHEKHPNVEIKMQYYSFRPLLEKLNAGELDFAITLKFDVEKRENVQFRIIETTKDHVVMHKDHRLANASKVMLSDFVNDVFIMVSADDSVESPKLILDSYQRAGVKPKIKFAPNIQTEMLWVQAGIGVCILDSRNSLKGSEDVRFVEVDGISDPSLVLVWEKNNTNPYLQTFIDHFTYYN